LRFVCVFFLVHELALDQLRLLPVFCPIFVFTKPLSCRPAGMPVSLPPVRGCSVLRTRPFYLVRVRLRRPDRRKARRLFYPHAPFPPTWSPTPKLSPSPKRDTFPPLLRVFTLTMYPLTTLKLRFPSHFPQVCCASTKKLPGALRLQHDFFFVEPGPPMS